MPLLPLQLRIAAKRLIAQPSHPLMHVRHRDRDHHWQRTFSHSPRRDAAEDPESILAYIQASPLIKQIADKPEALKALHDFANAMKDSGVDFTPDRQPSMMQMFKLATNPKLRQSAKRVIEELKNAGVDINSENAFELFGIKKPSSR